MSSFDSLRRDIDQTGTIWEQGKLVGKVGAAFTSGWSRAGGQEITLLTLLHSLLAHGMLIVGLPWSKRMVKSGWGRIVLIGDWSSEAAVYRNYAPYIVTKAAVPTLTKVLALELGSRSPGVTVNAVLPGPLIPPEGHEAADTEMVKRQTVLGSWVGAADVVRAVLFLIASDKVTGASLRVDGGRAIKSL